MSHSRRIACIIISIVFVISIVSPIFIVSADNSGFGQIRLYYKVMDTYGSWTPEYSMYLSDGSLTDFAVRYSSDTRPLMITRIQITNMSSTVLYFSFDLCFGSSIPVSGTYPSVSATSWNFTSSDSITAYSYVSSDKSYLVRQEIPDSDYYTIYNCSLNRRIWGKCTSTGYINFTNPVIFTYNQNNSPARILYMFVRHLIIGLDESTYFDNLEDYLDQINDSVSDIDDIINHHETVSNDFLDSGGSQALSDAIDVAPAAFGVASAIISINTQSAPTLPTYHYDYRFFSTWAYPYINAVQGTRNDDGYIDFYSQNLDQYWEGD